MNHVRVPTTLRPDYIGKVVVYNHYETSIYKHEHLIMRFINITEIA